jgi:tRNA threonylcarbamoyladenosine biosynthesis protein TsaE
VQGLAHGLGVREQVTSPTFAIYTVYRGAGRTLVHFDAYRLENAQQVESLLLEEFLVRPWVLAVEWPEKTGDWLPSATIHLTLSIVDGDQHRITLR